MSDLYVVQCYSVTGSYRRNNEFDVSEIKSQKVLYYSVKVKT